MRELLESLEGSGGDVAVPLAYLAGAGVELDHEEANAALRRAQLLLAAGGDPRRALEPDGRAVTALAADLDSPAAHAALQAELERLAADANGLPGVSARLAELLADDELAWRSYACALLAESLGED